MLVFTDLTTPEQPNQAPSAETNYRYPAPQSQPKDVHVPSSESKDIVYNTQYYTRDIRRMKHPLEIGVHPSIATLERVHLPKDAKRGSPGNKVRLGSI